MENSTSSYAPVNSLYPSFVHPKVITNPDILASMTPLRPVTLLEDRINPFGCDATATVNPNMNMEDGFVLNWLAGLDSSPSLEEVDTPSQPLTTLGPEHMVISPLSLDPPLLRSSRHRFDWTSQS